MNQSKVLLKNLLGEIPLAAELYWHLRQRGQPLTAKFALTRLQKALPEWCDQARASRTEQPQQNAKHIFIFGTLRYWIEHVALLGVSLAGMGHRLTLAYLPYAQWQKPLDRFNLRRHNAYAQSVLRLAEPLISVLPLLNVRQVPSLSGLNRLARNRAALPPDLAQAIELVALRDTQYTLQVETVEAGSPLHQLRLERNFEAAHQAYTWLRRHRPDLVILPNGTILEFGAIYQVARHLNLPVVTYEFGEQRQRIWLAQNVEVMRQQTDALWEQRKDTPLSQAQFEQVRALFAARQRASLWQNFARRWQGIPSQGGEKIRADLRLDRRPIVLLATNVIGDSLTLGRQIFSDSMTAWLERTAEFFAHRPQAQLVIRIHPGELVTKGPSVADVITHLLPDLPENIHLIPADAQINTYDLIEIADLGLVYTTTVGLEMAMSGVPVIVVGNTHYRGKGFTLDPQTWEDYFATLDRLLQSPAQYSLDQAQVNQAWNYAYRFFFEYPHPFPWHLLNLWKDLEEWPLGRVLSPEGQQRFGNTFRYLAGEPIHY